MEILSLLSTFAILGTAYFLAHQFWKHCALLRAREWAARSNMTIIPTAPVRFEMHRQRPQITVHATHSTGAAFVCTLELTASSFFGDSLGKSANVKLLTQFRLKPRE